MSRREKFLSFSVYSQVIVGKDLSIEREITPQLHTSAFGTVCIVAPSVTGQTDPISEHP